MSKFLVRFEGAEYANDELYRDAIAGGERTFTKMLAKKAVVGKMVLDQALYPLTEEQHRVCAQYCPATQDFDAAYRRLNVVSKDTVRQIKENASSAFPGATVVSLKPDVAPEFFKYRHVVFFKVRDYKEARKYPMVPKMASVKLCGRLYVALNAVDVRVDAPIIATVEG
jgi:hypothetical protein